MGFVESVARELGHQVEDLFGFLGVYFSRRASGQEFFALRGHFLVFLFAHGAAQQVRIAQRKPGQAVGDLHHLFLIQNDAPGFGENLLQLRQIVGDFFLAVLAGDEVVDHAALNRAGTIQRVQRRQIFEARGLVTLQNVAHAVRFKLEYAAGLAAREQRVGFLVVELQAGEIDFHAAIFFDHAHGVVEHRQRGQAEEIHLEQTDALQRIHIVLRGDFFLVRLVQRYDFGERLGRNHHAGRVGRGVPRQTFEAHGHIDQRFVRAVFAGGFQLRRLLQRFFERNVQRQRNHFRQAIHVAVGHIQRAAGVF